MSVLECWKKTEKTEGEKKMAKDTGLKVNHANCVRMNT